MGVYINGMEIPKSCADCPMCYDEMECEISDLRFWRGRPENKEFKFTEERHPRCQLTDANEMRIYGYPVRALAEIAYTMREKGVSEYEAIDILKNTEEVAKKKLIRCRDCKYYHRYENHISSIFTLLEEPMVFEECKYHKMSTTANDFCSCGERRTE